MQIYTFPRTPFIIFPLPSTSVNTLDSIASMLSKNENKPHVFFFSHTPISLSQGELPITPHYIILEKHKIPNGAYFCEFKRIVYDSIFSENSNLIGICGKSPKMGIYIIARWYVEELNYTLAESLDIIKKNCPPGITKQKYLNSLNFLYPGETISPLPSNSQTSLSNNQKIAQPIQLNSPSSSMDTSNNNTKKVSRQVSSPPIGSAYTTNISENSNNLNNQDNYNQAIYYQNNYLYNQMNYNRNSLNQNYVTNYNQNNQNNYNQGNLGQNSYNQNNYNQGNLGQNSYNQRSQSNFNQGIYNQNSYNQSNFNPNNKGNLGQNSYNQYNYNQNSYNQNNYNQNNYNQNNYNQNNYNQNGYNQNSYNQNSYNQNSYNQNSYNQNSYNQNSYNQNNYNQNGYNQGTFNQNNYNQNYYTYSPTPTSSHSPFNQYYTPNPANNQNNFNGYQSNVQSQYAPNQNQPPLEDTQDIIEPNLPSPEDSPISQTFQALPIDCELSFPLSHIAGSLADSTVSSDVFMKTVGNSIPNSRHKGLFDDFCLLTGLNPNEPILRSYTRMTSRSSQYIAQDSNSSWCLMPIPVGLRCYLWARGNDRYLVGNDGYIREISLYLPEMPNVSRQISHSIFEVILSHKPSSLPQNLVLFITDTLYYEGDDITSKSLPERNAFANRIIRARLEQKKQESYSKYFENDNLELGIQPYLRLKYLKHILENPPAEMERPLHGISFVRKNARKYESPHYIWSPSAPTVISVLIDEENDDETPHYTNNSFVNIKEINNLVGKAKLDPTQNQTVCKFILNSKEFKEISPRKDLINKLVDIEWVISGKSEPKWKVKGLSVAEMPDNFDDISNDWESGSGGNYSYDDILSDIDHILLLPVYVQEEAAKIEAARRRG